MTPVFAPDQAAAAYDRLAPYYDVFTAGYAYEPWVAAIERRAIALGLCGTRALDLACGTGNSTRQLLERGYDVLACDVSEQMLSQARRKFPKHADSFIWADMRELPALGAFDLVLCLDDAVNYLLSDEELEAAFSGVASVLAPGGVFAFDVNSLRTYRTAFAEAAVKENDGLLLAWRGETTAHFERGAIGSARVEIFTERHDGLWERSSMRHVQRHHSPEAIRVALSRAGLVCSEVAGQRPGARLEPDIDEECQIKLVYFARHAAPGERR
jgi:SAM-dependent methyltransferase